jgi:hypothetical protein
MTCNMFIRLAKYCSLLLAILALDPSRQSLADLVVNFNSENGGVGVVNYTGLANWIVTAG